MTTIGSEPDLARESQVRQSLTLNDINSLERLLKLDAWCGTVIS
jgi:hypothetical protein